MKYDQLFLTNKKVIEKAIKEAQLKKSDVVLEIGPGRGILTKELAKHSKVIAIEIDKDLKLNIKNVELIYGNALKLIDALNFNKIISNIPYSITEPLFKKLLKKEFELAILMIGKKFYKKIQENSKWSIIIPAFFKIKKITDVPKDSFTPKPKKDSVLIKIIPRPKNKIIHKLVLQSDKKVKNALLKIFWDSGLTKRQAKAKLKELNIQKSLLEKRLDLLSNKEFELIYNKISKSI
jgi:16S rRNA (adenine1518-N6/adenine1519-N6)-dimethyltransferase